MARINLLPWRQEERERKNREFLMLGIATALLAVILSGLVWAFFNNDLSNQRAANERITAENTNLDAKLAEISELEKQRNAIIERIKVIQDLQGRRPVPVHLWADMARAMPSYMYFTEIKREDDVITIKGFADNPKVVADLITNLNNSPWMDNSAVVNIQRKIEAYQDPAQELQKQLNGGNANANADGKKPREPLPEDNYVQFEVTTRIQYGDEVKPADPNATNNAAPVLDNGAAGNPTIPAPSNGQPSTVPANTNPAPNNAQPNTQPASPNNAAPQNTPAQPSAQGAQNTPNANQAPQAPQTGGK